MFFSLSGFFDPGFYLFGCGVGQFELVLLVEPAQVLLQLVGVGAAQGFEGEVAGFLYGGNPLFGYAYAHVCAFGVFLLGLFGAHLREEEYLLNGRLSGHEHDEAVEAESAEVDGQLVRSLQQQRYTSGPRAGEPVYTPLVAFGMMVKKMLKKIYHDDPSGYAAALERHTAFFNITVCLAPFVGGIAMSMEERIAKGEMPPESVNDIKAALMGPLSGIGDAVFLTTIRVVAAGIAISLASQGNVLGPIIFLLLFNVPQYFLRVWGIHKGYEIGVSLLETAEQSGIMDKVIKAAGIIGMMVVGSMTCGMFWASLAVEFGSGEEVTTLQSVLDGIMPGMLGLAFMGLYYFLLKKKVSPMILILGTMVLGVVGVYFGILA